MIPQISDFSWTFLSIKLLMTTYLLILSLSYMFYFKVRSNKSLNLFFLENF